MADTILVIVEQREGKLNRVSFETIAGAQAMAAETGWTLEAAVAGSGLTGGSLHAPGADQRRYARDPQGAGRAAAGHGP